MPVLLDRWTGSVAKGTKDAAVPGVRGKCCAANGAVVKIDTGVRRHSFCLLGATIGALDCRF